MKTTLSLLTTILFTFSCIAQEVPQTEEPSKFSIAAGVGFGYRTAKIAPGLSTSQRNHEKKMLSGISYFVMPRYQLNESYSIGLSYRAFHTSGVTGNYGLTIANILIDHIDENRKIFFIGPTLHNHVISDTAEFNGFVSLGYIGFKSEAILNRSNIPFKTTGGNLGLDLGIEYLWKLSPKFYVGAAVGYTIGTLTKTTVEANGVSQEVKLNDDQKEGLQFLSLNPVLRLYL